MSDITKKILSIETENEPDARPAKDRAAQRLDKPIEIVPEKNSGKNSTNKSASKPYKDTPHASDIPSLRRDTQTTNIAPNDTLKPNDFPDFISRKNASAASLARTMMDTEYSEKPPKTTWIMRAGIAMSLIWILTSLLVLYALFGVNTAISSLTPVAISASVLAVVLPAVLITILWTTWRRLSRVSFEAERLAHAAQVLTRADESALINTRNLALGIQSELSMVDEHLAKMLNRFGGLKDEVNAHSRDINAVGLTLTERSENVGRHLTLQRQALESITNTFDTRMNTLSDTIETQNLKLTAVTQQATDNINSAEQGLSSAAKTIGETTDAASGVLGQETERLISAQTQLTNLHENISDLITKLVREQDKIKSGLSAQSQALLAVAENAKVSSETLKSSLSEGHDILQSLDSINQDTDQNILKRFKTMEKLMADTQIRADEFSQSTSSRVQDSLSRTRKELSQLETEMQVLRNSLSNARDEQAQLSLSPSAALHTEGLGRLGLRPLDTDFPPVEPPKHVSAPLFSSPSQPALSFEATDENRHENSIFGDVPRETSDAFLPNADNEAPINLGADMDIDNPDNDLTGFDPDILRPAADDIRNSKKGFGQSKNIKDKSKNSWRWRDMLGGLDRPDEAPLDLGAPLTDQAIHEQAPEFSNQRGTENNPPLPREQTLETEHIIRRLARAQLSPAAIVTEGTVMEAAKARMKKGPAAMMSVVDKRLTAPVAHLRSELARDSEFEAAAKNFTVHFGQIIAQASPHGETLRHTLGTPEGRAYLLCAAAVNKLR